MRGFLLVALAGCAGAEAMTLPPQPVTSGSAAEAKGEFGFVPGETMAFDVHLSGMLAGEAQLAVGEIGDVDGHRAVVVKSRASTAGAAKLVKNIVDEATTTIDVDTGRPLQLDTSVVINDKSTTAVAKFTGSIANVTYTKDGDPTPHTYRVDFGKVTVHDSHSATLRFTINWIQAIDKHCLKVLRPPIRPFCWAQKVFGKALIFRVQP